MENSYKTFYRGDKEYKSPSTKKIKSMLSEIGINTKHNCLIRKQVHIIVNDIDKLNVDFKSTDTHFQTTVKEKIIAGEKSFILKV